MGTMKKIIVIIIVAATILNIVVGAFLFLDIQQMNIPETTLTIELINITADEAILDATLLINNQNSFPIFLQNLEMTTIDDNGETVNHLSMDGGEVKAHENKTFASAVSIRFNGSPLNHLTSRVTGTFGTMFLGMIKKTFPLKFQMKVSLNDILKRIFTSSNTSGG